jgi:hypothetical protein
MCKGKKHSSLDADQKSVKCRTFGRHRGALGVLVWHNMKRLIKTTTYLRCDTHQYGEGRKAQSLSDHNFARD